MPPYPLAEVYRQPPCVAKGLWISDRDIIQQLTYHGQHPDNYFDESDDDGDELEHHFKRQRLPKTWDASQVVHPVEPMDSSTQLGLPSVEEMMDCSRVFLLGASSSSNTFHIMS